MRRARPARRARGRRGAHTHRQCVGDVVFEQTKLLVVQAQLAPALLDAVDLFEAAQVRRLPVVEVRVLATEDGVGLNERADALLLDGARLGPVQQKGHLPARERRPLALRLEERVHRVDLASRHVCPAGTLGAAFGANRVSARARGEGGSSYVRARARAPRSPLRVLSMAASA